MLQIQNIKLNYSSHSPEQKFEIYIHSIISFIDLISAYDLEIAKYAFWDIDSNTINRLSERIHKRRKYIKNNFYKNGSDLDRCCWVAFDSAMDIHWLTGANLSEDIGMTININGMRYSVEHWVGTNDHKLHYIAQDIHHVYHDGSTMKALESSREDELSSFPYWRFVDRMSEDILRFRMMSGKGTPSNITERIDIAVKSIENDLSNYFSTTN